MTERNERPVFEGKKRERENRRLEHRPGTGRRKHERSFSWLKYVVVVVFIVVFVLAFSV